MIVYAPSIKCAPSSTLFALGKLRENAIFKLFSGQVHLHMGCVHYLEGVCANCNLAKNMPTERIIHVSIHSFCLSSVFSLAARLGNWALKTDLRQAAGPVLTTSVTM